MFMHRSKMTTSSAGTLAISMALAALAFGAALAVPQQVIAAEPADESADPAPEISAEEKAYYEKLRALHWVKGPATVDVMGDSKLVIPEGYSFLNQGDTSKFLELNENLSDGSEVMISPESLGWSAYISFSDDGYVKDDDEIDAADLLKSMKENTESANVERLKRGWAEMHVVDWAVTPAYNASTKRLEWATRLRSGSGTYVNFFTKVLGRKGHTTVILVTSPADLAPAQLALNEVLTGYSFNPGSRYAEYVPGDKVAEYGLAALVLGGAAAVATKKGFWAVIASFLAAAWKFVAAAVVGVGAYVRRFFSKKTE